MCETDGTLCRAAAAVGLNDEGREDVVGGAVIGCDPCKHRPSGDEQRNPEG